MHIGREGHLIVKYLHTRTSNTFIIPILSSPFSKSTRKQACFQFFDDTVLLAAVLKSTIYILSITPNF